jgi:uncharacterized protein
MAVVAMWQCDRDGKMFASKKDAEEYDKMLELAESFASLIEAKFSSISEEDAEAIGLLLSQHKEEVLAACKGKPEELLAIASKEQDTKESAAKDDKKSKKESSVVTPIAAKG